MDIERVLAQLRCIQPDEDYAVRSRTRILRSGKPWFSLSRSIFARAFEAGSAIALAGVLVFLILGGFSVWQGSYRTAGFDPATLQAEAQAIDARIKLVSLDYEKFVAAVSGGDMPGASNVQEEPDWQASVNEESTEAMTSSTPPTIDDVLEELLK